MTRDEAIDKFEKASPLLNAAHRYPDWVIDGLVALGLLHLETTEDKVRVAAAERLMGVHVGVQGDAHSETYAKITQGGAFEILDVLIKSGFRITRD
jgi:hypothetical protein